MTVVHDVYQQVYHWDNQIYTLVSLYNHARFCIPCFQEVQSTSDIAVSSDYTQQGMATQYCIMHDGMIITGQIIIIMSRF